MGVRGSLSRDSYALHPVLSSAYEVGDISYIYPIARSAPAFVPLAAFLTLGETVSLQGGFGILIVVVAIFVLQMRGRAVSDLQQLWASLTRKDCRWAFATLGTVVTYTVIDKAGMVTFSRSGAISPTLQGPLYFLLESAVCYLFFWATMLFSPGLSLGVVWRREWSKVVEAALGTMGSYSLILYVMQSENVSYIVALRQASVFLAVLVGSQGGVRKVTACGFSGDAGWVLSGSHGKVSGSASLTIGSIERTDVIFIPVNKSLP